MSTNDANTKEGVEKRTIRAATESMALDWYAGDTGEYDVYAESGSVYRVNLIGGSCSCPDDQHNAPAGGCKHLRRVEMETGQREIPAAIATGRTDVERMIRARDGNSQTDQQEVATDGGVTVESDQTADQRPEYTVHYEPAKQGGEKYVRCEGCGRELLTELGGRDSLLHPNDCPNARGE